MIVKMFKNINFKHFYMQCVVIQQTHNVKIAKEEVKAMSGRMANAILLVSMNYGLLPFYPPNKKINMYLA